MNMNINSEFIKNGFLAEYNNRKFKVVFPEQIWKDFPHKEILKDNFTYLAAIEPSLMFKTPGMEFDFPLPLFKAYIDELFLRYLPYAGDCDHEDPLYYQKRLLQLKIKFSEKMPVSFQKEKVQTKETCLNTMTFGKESLLSFALARELEMNPQLVTVFDEDLDLNFRGEKISSFTNKHFLELIPRFETEFGVKIQTIKNEAALMRSNVIWDLDDTDLGNGSVITEFFLLLLPFIYFQKAKYLVLGCESSCDNFYLKDGIPCNPVYDQSSEWIKYMNQMLEILLGPPRIISLVEPLQEIAISKILYQRYPEIAKYQTSCHTDNIHAKNNRWCGHCSKCAWIYTFMKALNFDPKPVGLRDMFSSQDKKFYSIFGKDKEMCPYDLSGLGRDEQLFAFYLATLNGAKGELIEVFKKEYFDAVKKRDAELRKKFFSLSQPKNLPEEIWKRLRPILEEELKK